ncbi:MAG: hypothetical protein IPI02_23345 [Sterolibacteriaceae bacterium]|nr:hypothetical protein [Sterolibacteriaceae bacterium]
MWPRSSCTRSGCTGALDRLLPHKEAIEAHLVKRFGELFDLDHDLLLYDDEHVLRGRGGSGAIAKRG